MYDELVDIMERLGTPETKEEFQEMLEYAKELLMFRKQTEKDIDEFGG